jgi:gamma-glutamyl-gamma-aminobutyrate hydrolase PuuD
MAFGFVDAAQLHAIAGPEKAPGPPPVPTAGKARSRSKRPVIGVTKPADGDWFSYQALRLAVIFAGGKPLKVTARAPRAPRSVDGLLFGGGADVFPERYEGSPKQGYRYDLARDDMEASWAAAALEHDIPILGICRGMQMLNVLAGGALYTDLSRFDDRAYPTTFLQRVFYRVPIQVDPGSRFAEITGQRELRVNSIHSQAIDRLGQGFVEVAHETNGLVQAIEHARRTFLVGVQFHPEFLIYHRFARRLFESLITAAREHALRRDASSDGPA